jgi:hypothetical protein
LVLGNSTYQDLDLEGIRVWLGANLNAAPDRGVVFVQETGVMEGHRLVVGHDRSILRSSRKGQAHEGAREEFGMHW